jgi:hypothetical protein
MQFSSAGKLRILAISLLWLLTVSACTDTAYVKRNAESFAKEIELNQASADYLAAYVRQLWASPATAAQELIGPAPAELGQKADNEVVISLYGDDGKPLRATGVGGGNLLVNSFSAAGLLQRAYPDLTTDSGRLRIDIVNRKWSKNLPAAKAYKRISRGIEGFVLFQTGSEAYFLPGDWLAAGLGEKGKKNKWMRDKRKGSKKVADFLGLKPEKLKDKSVNCYKIATFSFIENSARTGTLTLFRGIPLVREVNPERLAQSIRWAGDYLTRIMRPTGRFYYEHNPLLDRYNKTKYNILRHSGTIYSMLQIYEAFPNPQLLAAIERGIGYFISRLKPNKEDPNAMFVLEHKKAKLGGVALGLLALSEYHRVTGTQKYSRYTDSLARHIELQQGENGFLASYYRFDPDIKVPDRHSIYYPGEALYAMLKYAETTPDPAKRKRAVTVAGKACDYLVNIRPGEAYFIKKYPGVVPPDAWLEIGLYEYFRHTGDDQYNHYSIKIAKLMMKDQKLDVAPKLDYYGGYIGTPPQSTPAGARGEGMVGVYRMLTLAGEETISKKVLRTIANSAGFIMSMQVSPDGAYYYPDRESAIGALRENPDNHLVRIDFVQHNVSALIGLMYIMQGKEIAPIPDLTNSRNISD